MNSGLAFFCYMNATCQFKDEIVQVWNYLDRLMIHLLYERIKPTFKHVISPLCLHLSGPSVIKKISADIKTALDSQDYAYVMRLDIRGYYANIHHDLLLAQLQTHYQDPLLHTYFEAIVNAAVDKYGDCHVPRQGIPRRSSLSPFFGALYLSALDNAFTQRKGMMYRRYMDDIIILIDTPRHYRNAKKQLFTILRSLRLQLSPSKTRMGTLKKGFHFLGVNIEVPRSPQGKIQSSLMVHSRTCRRALDRLNALREDAVHPAKIQCYLIRWARWWHAVVGDTEKNLLAQWILFAEEDNPFGAWLARGLLLEPPGQQAHYTLSLSLASDSPL